MRISPLLFFAVLVGLASALAPAAASAAGGEREDDVLLRINGDAIVRSGEQVGSVIVIKGNARVEGAVKDLLLVIDGNAFVSGTVRGDITVISGSVDLAATARVKNVSLVRSDLTRTQGATVSGRVRERERFFFRGAAAVFSILFWAGMTVAVLAAGLLFAAIGGRQLGRIANSLTAETPATILAALVLWIGLPIAAVALFFTLVGIPLGIGLLVVVLPALWLLGYIAVGARLGGTVFGLAPGGHDPHPYAAVTLGLLCLQLAVLVPVIGALMMLLAGTWGGGAVAYAAFRAASGRGPDAAPASSEGAAPAAPAA